MSNEKTNMNQKLRTRAPASKPAPFTDVVIRREPCPTVCFRSGLAVYDEALHEGRLLGRYHAATGFIDKPAAAKARQERIDVPMHAFGLQMDGQALHFGWDLAGMRELKERPGRRHAVVDLVHQVRPVRVAVHTLLDGTPIMQRWLEITNTADRPATLGEVWPWSGVLMEQASWQQNNTAGGPPAWSLGSFVDCRWGAEGDFQWRPLQEGVTRIESRMGKSGHGAPFFVVRNDNSGEMIIGHLAWSGNWGAEFTRDHDQATGSARLWFKAGPQAPAPMRILAPGETVVTPAVHLGYLMADFDGTVQAMHEHLRRSVLLPAIPGRDNLVIYNHWGYTEHELSEASVLHEIDVAADVGAELFVIDAGWYADKDTLWWDTTGDWQPGNRLPRGFKPIRDHLRRKKMLFGLWVDAERIGNASKIHARHPDWLMQKDGKRTDSDLDLSNPAAARWMEKQIIRIVEEYELDLFRLDYNAGPWEGGQTARDGFIENGLWRHYEAVYGIYDRLHKRFPKLLLENCSGGGGRTDIGLVSRFHHTWTSDWQIAPRSFRILNGMTMALPPEYVDRNAGVGQDGHRRGDLDFQLRAVLFGHMTLTGVHPPGVTPNPLHMARFQHHVRLYKTFVRPFLRTSRVYHHTAELPGREPTGWGVLEYASADQTRALAGLFRLTGPAEDRYLLRCRGLSRQQTYQVTCDNSGETTTVSGTVLMDQGLSIRLDHPLTSELVMLQSIR